jgi:uncharacterized protein YyaL (SSP411 family)
MTPAALSIDSTFTRFDALRKNICYTLARDCTDDIQNSSCLTYQQPVSSQHSLNGDLMTQCKTLIFLLSLILSAENITLSATEPYTNRLIKEKSPYLLQHAHNPVDWFPWGEEAFNKAKSEDKLIFLSIGYSTCHWCHVMEEESFSNPEIAAILNKHFVSIKVDREERPDIDNVHMSIVVGMTGSGGWPLTVILTPDRKPFYGGTYFPPEEKWGKPGLKSLLTTLSDTWKNQKSEILHSGDILVEAVQLQTKNKGEKPFPLNQDTLKDAYNKFLGNFDSQYGGFGYDTKFPSGHSLSFLLRYWKRSNEPKAFEMVEKTLTSIAAGGIHDHIGGGFHRYSTDARWLVPHFEKMLYDQAILSRAYLEAYQATHKEEYAAIARDIFEYVLRDMTSPEGGFYSAEDADSAYDAKYPSKKKEGVFYLWSKDEIISLLGKEQGDIFCYYFGVEKNGNASFEPSGESRGENILFVAHSLQDTAAHFNKMSFIKQYQSASLTEIRGIIKDSKAKLFAVRAKRPRPHLDDKVLADWNGLMISSLAFGSRVLNEPRYAQAAEKSARFIIKHLVRQDGRLLHRYRDGESAITGMIDDYAFFIHGLIDLYEATFNPEYLREAKRLTDDMLKNFWDEKEGGFFFTSQDAEKLLLRQKEIYDGAIPSGNSIAALDLIRLSRLFAEKKFDTKAELLLKVFSPNISSNPDGYSQTLIALDFALGPSREIVIAGAEQHDKTDKMIGIIYRYFIPNKVVVFRPASGKEAQEIILLSPFLKDNIAIRGKTTAYVCVKYACQLPANSVEQLKNNLKE